MLEQVRSGELAVDEASARLRSMPFEDLGFARVDHHRALRCGFPEVIFCTGKTDEQVAAIAERIVASGSDLLATRATPAMYEAVTARCPSAEYHEAARAIVVQDDWQDQGVGEVLVVSAGTSDIPVAEEAAVTARVMGNGASFNGLAALLAMLNSCASGVTVVNIDGGFNAGYAAGLINRKHE